jgi:hypothetical protein
VDDFSIRAFIPMGLRVSARILRSPSRNSIRCTNVSVTGWTMPIATGFGGRRDQLHVAARVHRPADERHLDAGVARERRFGRAATS